MTRNDHSATNGAGPSAHPDDPHYIHRSGWLRAAVLGANDGIVSVASLLAGIAASGADRHGVLLAGIAGGRLQDVVADGRTLWRLRVAADDHSTVPQLVQRIAALGLGQPRVVND